MVSQGFFSGSEKRSKRLAGQKENKVALDGGDLFIKWLDNGSVTLSGETERVFEGFIGE